MDEIFGEQNFVNEVIWKKTNAHNFKQKGFVRANDVIYLYAFDINNFNFNEQFTEISDAQLSRYKKDEDGRYYTGQDLTFTGNSANRKFSWRGATPPPGRVWGMDYDQLEDLYKRGLILLRKDGVPRLDGYKVYLEDKKGTPLTNIWDDVDRVGNTSSERIDYATQKPEALLERIIKVSSNEGMLVADFFGGSGTTARVAARLNRRFIHTDIGINSILVTRDKLKEQGAEFDVLEVKDGVQLYRNPVQTMDKLKSLIKGLRNEDQLDKFWEGSIMTTKDGMVPVYLPNLMDSSTRLLDKPLMNRIIREAMPDLPDDTKREYNEKSAAQAQSKGRNYKPLTISDEGLEQIEWLSLDCEQTEHNAPWHSSVEVYIDKNGYTTINGKGTDKLWDGTIRSLDERKPLRLKIRNICGDETIYNIE